jgi:hypothetical protein
VKSEFAAKKNEMQDFFSPLADFSGVEVCPRQTPLVRFLQSTQSDRKFRQQVVNSLLTFADHRFFFTT